MSLAVAGQVEEHLTNTLEGGNLEVHSDVGGSGNGAAFDLS